MKKHLSLFAALALAVVSASAQSLMRPFTASSQSRLMAAKSMKTVPFELSTKTLSPNNAVKEQRAAKAAKASETTTLDPVYNIPSGALFDGIRNNLYGGSIAIAMPALKEIPLYNYTDTVGGTYVWTDPTGYLTYETDAYGGTTFKGWGYYYAPKLTLTMPDNTTASFQYSYVTSSETYPCWFRAGVEEPDTLCNADCKNGLYFGFTSGASFLTKANFKDTGKNAVGFAEYYESIGCQASCEGIYMVMCSTSESTITSPFDGKEMTATIYSVDDSGNMSVYATATASEEDVMQYSGTMYLQYKFKEEDPEFGTMYVTKPLPDSDFLIVANGFGDLTNQYYGCFSTPEDTQDHYFAGHGYVVLEDDSFSSVYYADGATPYINMHIGLMGIAMPTAEVASDAAVVTFPTEGGLGDVSYTTNGTTTNYNNVVVYTAQANWEVESKPDWITDVELDVSNITDNKYLSVTPTAAALEGTTGRTGEIVLATDYLKTVTITVNQGDVTGISTAVVDNIANTDKATYNILGQRVNKNAKGLLIKGGKKYIKK